MQSLLYALNIGTLATWLAVSGASSVAVAVKVSERMPKLNDPGSDEVELVITDLEEIMGSAPPAAPEDAALAEVIEQQEEQLQPEEIPEIPDTPEIPEIAEMEDLPDIPDLPAVPDGEIKPKPAPAVAPRKSEQPKQAKRTAPSQNHSGVTGQGSGEGAGTAKGSGSSPTGANRWVGLYAPKPSYPSASRRAGETGRVGITFTVDERGFVVSAHVSSPCSYAALNEAALAKVRASWRAKPGARATATKTVVFQLN